MARTISDEQIKLSVIIDGNPAQKELLDVEKSIRNLNKEQLELRKEKQALEKAGQKESARYKEITQTMRENTAAINANKTRMAELQKEIGITGLTMAQLRSKATALRATLNNLVPGSADYQRLDAELRQVNARMSELRGNATAAGFSIGRLADGFNRYAALGASVIATATGVVFSIQKILDISGKLSDAQSDVQKTTGMTKGEVDDLTKSFGLLQTRTQRIDLLKIAEQGGRIGIAKDEIQDFVKVMDKSAVALGDSFTGGVEQVADELGKIKFLFKETKDAGVETSYLAIGSAINVLGAEGSASEENIANFTKRIGSLPDVIKPTVAETMALGAAFEESGIEAEVSARAYSIFLKQASTETAKFAKVMGVSQEQVEKMINDDPLEFFLKFSKQLSESAKKGTDMSKVLDQLGLNADGVNKIVGSAGNNVDRFRQLVDISNKSFNDGTSLIDEYNIKNNNLAATLEKIQKKVMGFFVPEDFVNGLGDAANWFAKFIGATEDADGKVTAWRNTLAFTAKIIAIVTAALMTNVAWQKLVAMWTTRNTEATLLYNIASKARAFADGVAIIATQGFAAAQMLLTGNLKGATQAIRVMNTVLKTTPWGFVLSMIAAVVVAYQAFSSELSKTEKLQKSLADVELETAKSISKQKSELEKLVKIAQDETNSKETRLKAIKRLNEISPEYLGNLNLENIKTFEAKKAIDAYTDSLYKNARAKAVQAKYDEIVEKELEVGKKTSKDYNSIVDNAMDKFWAAFGVKTEYMKSRADVEKLVSTMIKDPNNKRYTNKETGEVTYSNKDYEREVSNLMAQSGLLEKEKELFDLKSERLFYEAELEKNFKDNTIKTNETTTTNGDGSTTGAGDIGNKKEKKYDDSYLDQEKRFGEELIKLQQKSEEERIAILGEGYAKEMQMQIANFNNKQSALKQELEAKKSLQTQLDKDLIEAQNNGDTRKVASIKNMQQLVLAQQNEINKQMQYEEQMHYLKIGTIQEKAGQKQVDKIKSQYEQEKIARETAFLLELESLDLSEKEKQKRKEQFAKDELALEEKMLNEQLTKLNSMLQNVEFDGIIFDLLSDEEKENLKNDIILVQNAIAKLKAAQNGENTEDSKKELDLGISEQTDILGFTQEKWDNFFKNIENGKIGFQTMAFAIQAAQNLFSQFDQYQTASENASLKKYERNQDARKRALKRQLDSGQINQVQYKRKIEEMDQELDRKKAEIEYKQAKRQRLMAIANIVMNTAQAIIGIWAQFPKFDFGATAAIMSGVVGALGALQLATVLKTPLPAKGYEQGLYPQDIVREQDGKKFKAGYGGKTKSGMVTKPTYFLAGENNKPEMVIDNKAYRDLSPYTRNLLINELRGIKGFENGYYNQQAMQIEVPATTTPTVSNIPNEFLVSLIAENTEVMKELKDLKENGVIAYISKDLKEMKKLQEQLDKYKNLKNNNKV